MNKMKEIEQKYYDGDSISDEELTLAIIHFRGLVEILEVLGERWAHPRNEARRLLEQFENFQRARGRDKEFADKIDAQKKFIKQHSNNPYDNDGPGGYFNQHKVDELETQADAEESHEYYQGVQYPFNTGGLKGND